MTENVINHFWCMFYIEDLQKKPHTCHPHTVTVGGKVTSGTEGKKKLPGCSHINCPSFGSSLFEIFVIFRLIQLNQILQVRFLFPVINHGSAESLFKSEIWMLTATVKLSELEKCKQLARKKSFRLQITSTLCQYVDFKKLKTTFWPVF